MTATCLSINPAASDTALRASAFPAHAEPEEASARREVGVVLIGDGPRAAAAASAIVAAGARVQRHLTGGDMWDQLGDIAFMDALWIAGSFDAALLDRLAAHAAHRRAALVVDAAAADIDLLVAPLFARNETGPEPRLLVDADAIERQAAAAGLHRRSEAYVAEGEPANLADRVAQLQDEVMRIARLLDRTAPAAAPETGYAYDFHYPAHDRGLTGEMMDVQSPRRGYTPPPGDPDATSPAARRSRARMIRQMIRRRRMRDQFFPAELFADPAWDILLDLYAARLEGHSVSVSSLCIAAAVPATTALRWIRSMTEAGLLQRDADPRDGRRVFIALGDAAVEGLDRYFDAIADQGL